MKIYVGSLPYRITGADLKEIFEEYGEVMSSTVIMDKYTGRSKGFGFVEMGNDEEAKKAIEQLNSAEVEGRTIVVNQALEQKDNFRNRDNRRDDRSRY
ncbi:MAG: RNA-binding protein [Bacteroidales bacterium]|jgi:RNA recognition motif-containing protein|nr:RNA-binding protein [Bacteroidales bacterium]MDD2570336.1 RNA-binding protein [Bacteroidales bacterium]MDD2812066.1 RNA-binding protein [Bacteroidales bacterium]MDD3385225.1 RNA-binding protein [Bacteroidales bacterium]MDD3811437.1 RNA-binding protein [Bacteroidales bacterium]